MKTFLRDLENFECSIKFNFYTSVYNFDFLSIQKNASIQPPDTKCFKNPHIDIFFEHGNNMREFKYQRKMSALLSSLRNCVSASGDDYHALQFQLWNWNTGRPFLVLITGLQIRREGREIAILFREIVMAKIYARG